MLLELHVSIDVYDKNKKENIISWYRMWNAFLMVIATVIYC